MLLLLLGVMADPPILVPPKMVKLEDLHHHALEQLPNPYLRARCNASCRQHGMLPTIAFFLYSRATAQPSNHTLTTRERERERERERGWGQCIRRAGGVISVCEGDGGLSRPRSVARSAHALECVA